MSKIDGTLELAKEMRKTLDEMFKRTDLTDECITNTELSVIASYLGDIAFSLAIIADKEG